jgi:hypothetical protein
MLSMATGRKMVAGVQIVQMSTKITMAVWEYSDAWKKQRLGN